MTKSWCGLKKVPINTGYACHLAIVISFTVRRSKRRVLVSLVTTESQMVLVSLVDFIKIEFIVAAHLLGRPGLFVNGIGATVYNFIRCGQFSCAKAGGKCSLLCFMILVRNPII
ncbi:hypothetical protein AMTRI_Chr11g97030 [Amborella trichopoda]